MGGWDAEDFGAVEIVGDRVGGEEETDRAMGALSGTRISPSSSDRKFGRPLSELYTFEKMYIVNSVRKSRFHLQSRAFANAANLGILDHRLCQTTHAVHNVHLLECVQLRQRSSKFPV
jgi:hypothetical protein